MSHGAVVHTDERPELSPGLRFVRHEVEGGVQWVVKDPKRQKYFRFGAIEAWLMQQMDGTRTLQEIGEDLRAATGVAASPAALQLLVRRLKELGLVLRSAAERSALLLEQLQTQRRIRLKSDNTLLRMRYSFGDPNDLMGGLVRRLPFFWTRQFVLVSLLGFLAYALIILTHFTAFTAELGAHFNPHLTAGTIVLSYAIVTGVSILHEFGHGLTCRRFGGEVREIGVMLLYFLPAFYCNITDAWTFEKRRDRLWVTFAGGWMDLCVATIAAAVWMLTEPGTAVNTVAAITAATAGTLSLLLNYNPLIPLDGYYALVDWLELPNLRGRSMEYAGAVIRRRVLGLDVRVPLVTDRERRIFLLYGIASATYSVLLLTAIAAFVALFAVARFGAWGAVAFAVLLLLATTGPRRAAVRLIRTAVAERLPRGARRRLVIPAMILIVVSLTAAVAPWTSRAPAIATVEAARRTWIRAPVDGQLNRLHVAEGQRVLAGDTLVTLNDPDLELEVLSRTAEMRSLERSAAVARHQGDTRAARLAEVKHTAAAEQFRAAASRRSDQSLLAPHDGLVATPSLADALGAHLVAGDSILELWDESALRVRLAVPQPRSGRLNEGAALRIRFPAYPQVTWKAHVEMIEPTADASHVVAWAILPAHPAYPLRPGMTGRARVDLDHTTVAGAMLRTARRLVRLDLLL